MPNKDRDLDEMAIWQNHEQRITTLEVTMSGLSSKMDKMDDSIKDGNKDQKDSLERIYSRMEDEFFEKKRKSFDNKWKIVFGLIGGGSILYLIIEKASQLFM